MVVWKLAWRNLWRTRKRTLITLSAIAFTSALLIVSDALMEGMAVHMVENATQLLTGEVEAHAPGYLADHSLYKRVNGPDALVETARRLNAAAAPRLYGYGLLAKGSKSAGAFFRGIDPAKEKNAFTLPRHTARGRFLEDDPRREIVLGKKIARSLQAEVGSEVVAVVQAADGSLGNDLYRVAGILKSAGEGVDRSASFIHEADFRDLFVMPEGVHEIAFNSFGRVPPAVLTGRLSAAAPGNDVKSWRDLLPTLSDMVNLVDGTLWIFGAVFFLAGGLGVMNTMLMATHERVREYGILKALGETPGGLLKTVLAEAALLGLAGTAAGTAVGVMGAWFVQSVGIDTSAFTDVITFSGIAFDPVWRGVLTWGVVVRPMIAMWTVCIAASVYPAVTAMRLDPVRAINKR